MKTAARKLVLPIAFAVAVLLANPRRGSLKNCGSCGTPNEPDRTACIGCGARF